VKKMSKMDSNLNPSCKPAPAKKKAGCKPAPAIKKKQVANLLQQ
jgi:hypothetical protein